MEAVFQHHDASHIVPRLPGIDGDNVIIVNDYYLRKDQVQDTVVVLGGDYVASPVTRTFQITK